MTFNFHRFVLVLATSFFIVLGLSLVGSRASEGQGTLDFCTRHNCLPSDQPPVECPEVTTTTTTVPALPCSDVCFAPCGGANYGDAILDACTKARIAAEQAAARRCPTPEPLVVCRIRKDGTRRCPNPKHPRRQLVPLSQAY